MKDLEKRPRSREKHMKVPETGMNSGSAKSKELMWLEQWRSVVDDETRAIGGVGS